MGCAAAGNEAGARQPAAVLTVGVREVGYGRDGAWNGRQNGKVEGALGKAVSRR